MSKKIIAVNAGPRKGWNTDTLINEAVKVHNLQEPQLKNLICSDLKNIQAVFPVSVVKEKKIKAVVFAKTV